MNHERHADIFDASRIAISLIGAGGIGSATALALSKMGIGLLHIYDGDVVDNVNLATQMFMMDHVGLTKVDALHHVINSFSDDTIVGAFHEYIDEDRGDIIMPIVISAVHTISARKKIWSIVKDHDIYYLDARMSSEQFHLYTVKPGQRLWYSVGLSKLDDDMIEEEPCTSKATIYTAFIAAGFIGAAVRKIITHKPHPRIFTFNILENNFIQVK